MLNSAVDDNPKQDSGSKRLTFFYGPSVSTVRGVIGKKAVTFTRNENNPGKDSIIVIALKGNVAVVGPPGTDTTTEEGYTNEHGVDTMQLVYPQTYNMNEKLGRTIELTGTLFHADNGAHFTNVLMEVSDVKEGDAPAVHLKY